MNNTYDMILIRYGEMTLKKDNYKLFLQKMASNIKKKLKKFEDLTYDVQPYRFYIYLNGVDASLVCQSLDAICGIYSYSLCKKVNKNIDEISACAIKMLKDYQTDNLKDTFSFKVETARSDKNYPLTSIEISKKVAALVLPSISGMKVNVHNPEVTLNIDFRFEAAYLYLNAIKGLGGYPCGCQGKGLSMISGGLDSPVSTFLSLKKGINVSTIHFFSYPYTSYNALQKVIDLLEVISSYSENDSIDIYIVPFTKIQDKIHNKANNIYMVTLMRRAMYKIASCVAKENNMQCIINGEAVGQVASQTLESMYVVNEVTNMPILRPLCVLDKEDIVSISKKIKTYDISIRPYEDCCTVFVPTHPVIKPKLEDVLKEEEKCDLDDDIRDAIANIKTIRINPNYHINAFNVFDDNSSDDKYKI